MNRPCLALSVMLASLAGTMLLVGTSHGVEIELIAAKPSRIDVCPLSRHEYFGCEYGIYAAAAGHDESAIDRPVSKASTANADVATTDNWDYYDDCYCFFDEEASPKTQSKDVERWNSKNDPMGIGHCLAGYDPAYDSAVYGVEAESVDSVPINMPAERHVEADYEFTYDEYLAVYGVELPRGGHIFVAEFEDDYDTEFWDEDLYTSFPESQLASDEANDTTAAESKDVAIDDIDSYGWEDYDASFYSDEYEAYEYDCHYGRNPWTGDRVESEESTIESRPSDRHSATQVGDAVTEMPNSGAELSNDTTSTDEAYDYYDDYESYDEAYYDDETGSYDYGDGYDYGYENDYDYNDNADSSDAGDAGETPKAIDPATRQAVDRVMVSPLARAAHSLTGSATANLLAALQDVDFVEACKGAIARVGQYQRDAVRQEMIAYYGLDDDEYAWSDADDYYENYYAIDFAANQPTSSLQRLANGCGRQVILDAAETLDQMGITLLSVSQRMVQMVETR